VNESSTLEAPAGAIDQMGHALSRIIHAMAEAGPEDKVFMAKFKIKDGFWRLNCKTGEEWNFAYVLPQEENLTHSFLAPHISPFLCSVIGLVSFSFSSRILLVAC
jgi:hypothetical protein